MGKNMRDFGDFYIIWPEKRYVTPKQMRIWYEDLLADGKVQPVDVKSHNAMAKALEDAGIITLGTAPASKEIEWPTENAGKAFADVWSKK